RAGRARSGASGLRWCGRERAGRSPRGRPRRWRAGRGGSCVGPPMAIWTRTLCARPLRRQMNKRPRPDPAMFDLQIPPVPVQERPVAAALEAPAWDLTIGLISATVQLDQRNGDGATRRVGTGFLIDAPRPDGSPRTVLVTAHHVLNGMPAPDARIGWRVETPDGGWRFAPEPLRIREETGEPVWTRHPERDIAVMEVSAPPAFARAAIPLGWLAEAWSLDA